MSESYGYEQDYYGADGYYDPAYEADFYAPEPLPMPIYEADDDAALDQAIAQSITFIQDKGKDAYDASAGAVRALVSDGLEGFAHNLASPLMPNGPVHAGGGFAVMPAAVKAQKDTYALGQEAQGDLREAIENTADKPFDMVGVDTDSPHHDSGRLAMGVYMAGKTLVENAPKAVSFAKKIMAQADDFLTQKGIDRVAQRILNVKDNKVADWAMRWFDGVDFNTMPPKIQNAIVKQLTERARTNGTARNALSIIEQMKRGAQAQQPASQLVTLTEGLTPSSGVSQTGNATNSFMTAWWANALAVQNRTQSTGITSGGLGDNASPLLQTELSLQMALNNDEIQKFQQLEKFLESDDARYFSLLFDMHGGPQANLSDDLESLYANGRDIGDSVELKELYTQYMDLYRQVKRQVTAVQTQIDNIDGSQISLGDKRKLQKLESFANDLNAWLDNEGQVDLNKLPQSFTNHFPSGQNTIRSRGHLRVVQPDERASPSTQEDKNGGVLSFFRRRDQQPALKVVSGAPIVTGETLYSNYKASHQETVDLLQTLQNFINQDLSGLRGSQPEDRAFITGNLRVRRRLYQIMIDAALRQIRQIERAKSDLRHEQELDLKEMQKQIKAFYDYKFDISGID